MKSLFLKLAAGAVFLLSLESCKKDETKIVLNNGASPQLTSTATTANISQTTGSNPGVTYTWTAADFGYKAAVTYTLQIAKQGTNFAAPQEYNVGNALSKSFTIKELNNLYNDIDCSLPAVPVAVALEARVKASVGDAAPAVLSDVKTLVASPYPDFVTPPGQWGLVGPAGDGWPGATATDRMMPYDCRVRAYVLRTTLKVGALKFRKNQDWGVNLGGPSGDFTKGIALTPGGSDLNITTAGTYTIKLEVTPDAAGTGATAGKVTITP